MAQKRVSDNDSSKHRRDASGKQAVVAKSMEHERLQVEKPESGGEHCGDDQGEKSPALRVTKGRQKRGAESCEISKRTESCQRNRPERRILTAKNFLATARRNAFCRPPGEMFHREIDSIRQPEKRDDRGHGIKALPQLIARAIGLCGTLRAHD